MTVVEGWTTRSGPRIRYLDNAPSDPVGLPILFSPGLSDFADEYRDMLEFFSPRRVVVVEVRGRGQSEAPETGYAASDHASDLRAVLDEERINRFHLMTFSRGTTWALEVAVAKPDLVASLSIGDYRAREIGLPATFVESQWQSRFRGRPMSERISRHVLEQLTVDSRPRELWNLVAALPCPLLVAQPGGTGGILTEDDIALYREARPDVQVVVVPDAPHDVFRPDRLFYPRAVAAFVDSVEG